MSFRDHYTMFQKYDQLYLSLTLVADRLLGYQYRSENVTVGVILCERK